MRAWSGGLLPVGLSSGCGGGRMPSNEPLGCHSMSCSKFRCASAKHSLMIGSISAKICAAKIPGCV
jgi:hypothetical protein